MKKSSLSVGEGPRIGAPGNAVEWDSIWAGLPVDAQKLFTCDSPRTLLQFWQRAYFEDLWALLGAGAERARCLELGSGRGTTSMYLASRGCDVTLVDLSPAALEQARSNFRAQGLREPSLFLTDARDSGLKPGSYDCV